MKLYTFYDAQGQEYHTDNLAAFCREHNLQRRHMNEVIMGKRRSHRGWSMTKPGAIEQATDDTVSLESVLVSAEIAARSVGGDYQKVVQGRVDRIRNGEPLHVLASESGIRLLD